ncbi:MFS general substrate transporter [Rhizophagus irregularis]|uniref:MFS general substrate transporter n=1 Tax=Rhizophagus irregularis TaxID=588596 RepID=A0A2N0PML3_9GLOM|nr:MFS general substrate transporter [Rhizophagus irregularis]
MSTLWVWQNLYIPKRFIVLGLCALAILINYAGYISTQVLGGAFADRFGGKLVLGVAAFGWTTFTLFTPSAAKLGLSYLLSCRILLGIAEGACIPSAYSLTASWAPQEERSRTAAIMSASINIGNIIALPVSTWLGSGPWRWQSIFWVFGVIGLVWSLFWQIYGGSDPSTYKGISKEELNLILKNNHSVSGRSGYISLPTSEEEVINRNSENVIDIIEDNEVTQDNNTEENVDAKSSNPSRIPWRVDIKHLGYFTVLPYIVQGISVLFVGTLADYMTCKIKVRVVIVRRIAQIISSWGFATFLLLATYVAKTPLQGIILISIGTGLNSFSIAGVKISQLDIAPRYSGVIFGLANSLDRETVVDLIQEIVPTLISEKGKSSFYSPESSRESDSAEIIEDLKKCCSINNIWKDEVILEIRRRLIVDCTFVNEKATVRPQILL